jgi:hypothetical protein
MGNIEAGFKPKDVQFPLDLFFPKGLNEAALFQLLQEAGVDHRRGI